MLEDQIIYRYRLTAAIAYKWVKTPVIVACPEDRSGAATQLTDGVALLGHKKAATDAYYAENGLTPINPAMLITARNKEELTAGSCATSSSATSSVRALMITSPFDTNAIHVDAMGIVKRYDTGDALGQLRQRSGPMVPPEQLDYHRRHHGLSPAEDEPSQ